MAEGQSHTGSLSGRRRVVAFNRLETRNWELLAALRHGHGRHVMEDLRDALREVTGAKHVLFAPSCRSAIAQILMMLPNEEVVMPAYTCSVLRPAAELAGKRIVYVDIPKNSLNATSTEYARKLKPGNVLMPMHLFGIPTDIEDICQIAKDNGCVTIEDVAAGFGATRNGRWLGTFADFGVFSFERTKRLPAFRGAAIIINNERLVDAEKLASQRVVSTTGDFPWRDLAFSFAHNVVTHPWLYGTLRSLHSLRKSVKTHLVVQSKTPEVPTRTPFYTRDFHSYQAGLLLRMLRRMDRIRDHIECLVAVYRDIFRNTPIQTFLDSSELDEGGLLRFPIAFPGRDRSEILRLARERGIVVETNYTEPLPDSSEHANFPNSVWASQNVVLLPLYGSLSLADAERLARGLVEIERETSCRAVQISGLDSGNEQLAVTSLARQTL
jgi:dTDP-4-amino-4,6-dideoxygalactose transaminase